MLMVNPVTVRQWASRGLLRSTATPGGHRRFLLSDVEEFARSRGSAPDLTANGRPQRVLIVDDDRGISRLVADLIRERASDVSVEIANDGFEAGAKVESFRPHALALDLMMPGMDGFEVCRRLRARKTLSHVRIVAMTGSYTEENVAKILEAGADACLAKPFDGEEMLKALGLEPAAQ